MKNNKKIQKRTLVKLIREGKVEAKCSYNYTDDYRNDAASNFGKTDWMPVCILEDNEFTVHTNNQGNEHKKYEHKSGFINFFSYYLESGSGTKLFYCQDRNGNEELNLRIHSNKNFELRIKE